MPPREHRAHVLPVTIALVALFVAYTLMRGDQAAQEFSWFQQRISATFGWLFLLSASFFLVFVVALALSRFGALKLGEDDAPPEFTRLAWFTMLFSAGMGIGLVFWGVAEPVSHYARPPMAEGRTEAAILESLRFSFFHWGLHTWAIYLVVALSLGYFHHRRGLPLAPRSVLHPLIGKRIHGWPGDLVDIVVIFATLFGLATSLGLGALQINTGLSQTLGVQDTALLQIVTIGVVTAIATVSVVLGVSRGILRLSRFNMILAAALLLFIVTVGPTLFILESLVRGLGVYLWKLPQTSLLIGDAAGASARWRSDWTLFYWGWWMSWAPFVGLFIARVSKGRTIREFIVGVLLVPVASAFVWFAAFGGTAMWIEHNLAGSIWQATAQDEAFALYAMLESVPATLIVSLAATLLVVTFFITSSDSGSLVISSMATGGEPRPPRPQRVFWSLTEGTLAVLLLLTGGLVALRTASITMGLPMALLLLLMCWSLVRSLRTHESAPEKARERD